MATAQDVRTEDGLGDGFAVFTSVDLDRFIADAVRRYRGRSAHPDYDRLIVLVAAHLAEKRRRAAGKSPYMVPDAPVKVATVDKVSTTFAVGDAKPIEGDGKDGLGSTQFGLEARELAARMTPAAFAPGGGRWMPP